MARALDKRDTLGSDTPVPTPVASDGLAAASSVAPFTPPGSGGGGGGDGADPVAELFSTALKQAAEMERVIQQSLDLGSRSSSRCLCVCV